MSYLKPEKELSGSAKIVLDQGAGEFSFPGGTWKHSVLGRNWIKDQT